MKKLLFSILACFMSICLCAQNVTVKGKVTDETGEPLPGISIRLKGSGLAAQTNVDGNYTIQAKDSNSILEFSYLGFIPQEIKIGLRTVIDVVLVSSNTGLDEVVVVGYGTQKRETVAGSVAAISGDELRTTKTQNVQNMMTGKLPGVRVVQRTSEPGEFNNQFDIRGFGNPLIVIDGVPRDNITRLNPNEIESISVLKDASAAIYGVRAANGVILITTKQGKGKPKIEYSGYWGYQTPIGFPKPVGAIDRMTLMNEKSMNNVESPVITYDESEFEAYRNGTRVSTDWHDIILRRWSPQQEHNISTAGSTKDDDITYFVNLGYTNQSGLWRSNVTKYDRYNVRSNISAKISQRLRASLNINGVLDESKRQQTPTWEVFSALWRAQPTEPYYANNDPDYLFKPLFRHVGALTEESISGYNKNKNNWIQSQFSLEYDIPHIEGLKAKGTFSYDRRLTDNTNYRKEYNTYLFDESTYTYLVTGNNTPQQITRNYGSNPQTLLNLSLTYNKTIAERHNIGALALYEETTYDGDNFNASRELALPLDYLFAGNALNQQGTSNASGVYRNTNKAFAGRINYDFDGKYIVEGTIRRDGSSKFTENKKWGIFPSVLLAWRISEEPFIKNNASLSFINNIKLRGSYGEMGDDAANSNQDINGYTYPFVGNPTQLPSGAVFDDVFVSSLWPTVLPNVNLTWYTVQTSNIGIDADLWNGKLGINFDMFKRNRQGLLATRLVTLPATFGASLPQQNLNKDQTSGAELALSHRNILFHDLGIHISANVNYTRTKVIFQERNMDGSRYAQWRNNPVNRYNDIWWGWGDGGQFTSYEEIANAPYFVGRAALPGDYVYEDWNNDGVIDDLDRHPIATGTNRGDGTRHNFPLITYGFTLGADYKGFDMNLLFQGGAMSYVSYPEQLSQPLGWDGNALNMFMNRWHPLDPLADPFNPSTEWNAGYYAYTGRGVDANSERNIQNGTYLRLKSAELGYTLPLKICERIGTRNVRLYTSAYNLFTITKVKFLDPEHPSELYGAMYPITRTVNFGASISF